jgi:hypothetical protein
MVKYEIQNNKVIMIEAFSAASLHFDKQFGDKVGLKLKEKSQKYY